MSFDSEWRGLVEHGLIPSVLGTVGRLMALATSPRKPAGFQLLWELPLAIGMGLIGISAARYLEVTSVVSYGIIIGAAYLGPKMIDQVVLNIAQRFKKPEKPLDQK